MLISYRNKFIKVFVLSAILEAIPLTYVISLGRALESGNYGGLLFNPSIPLLLIPIMLLAVGLQSWSFYLYARAKGYSGWLALMGLTNIFGLVLLVFLPDKRRIG